MHGALPSPTIERLDDQIKWYDRKSVTYQRWYKWLKGLEITVAAMIPLVTFLNGFTFLAALFGAIILILEGVQGINQFQYNWISYRTTSEQLKHEKFLWLAKAGPYSMASRPDALLAERVESLVSEEHAKWISTMEHAASSGGQGSPSGQS